MAGWGIIVEPFVLPKLIVLFWALVGKRGFRTEGWRMKVELGATFSLSGAAGGRVRTKEGEATGWGIKVGEIHPRLLGGVAYEGEGELDEEALDGYSLGGVPLPCSAIKVLGNVTRGPVNGDAARGIIEIDGDRLDREFEREMDGKDDGTADDEMTAEDEDEDRVDVTIGV